MPDGLVGDSGFYRYTVKGGDQPVTVAITAGSLPPGATMDDTGLVTYDYETAGSYAWTVTATGADGNTASVDDAAVVTTYTFPSPRSTWFAQPTSGRKGHMIATSADALGISNSASGITIACLIDAQLTSGNPSFYLSTGNSASNYRAAIESGTGGVITATGRRLDADTDAVVDSAGTYTDWLMAVVVFDYANGAITLHIDGAEAGTGTMGAGTTPATDSVEVGMHPKGLNRVRGGDTSVFASALSQSTIDKLFGYMAENWDMRASLPADHPYKTASVNGWTPRSAGARIWYYADNPDNTFPAADAISVLYDASENGNHAAGADTGDNAWITLSGELP